jgi:Zn-dependent peptidase ImmA (M78 family)
LVFVPELPGIRVSGVSHWISEQTPLIELCLRYKTADQLWFSLFHEACHVLRHSKKRTWVGFLGEDTPEERDANDFAADIMIPRRQWEAFVGGGKPSKARALEFARLVGVHPGIVVGRLQHEGLIPFNHMNALKQPIEWADA